MAEVQEEGLNGECKNGILRTLYKSQLIALALLLGSAET